MSLWMAALRGLGALPQLVKAVERIGDKLDEKAAMERLDDKRKRNDDAIRRVLESEDGQRAEVDRPPGVSSSNESGT